MDEPSEYAEPSPESFLPSPKRPPTGFELPPEDRSWLVPCLLAVAMLAVSLAHWGASSREGYAVATWHLDPSSRALWRLVSALFAHGDFDHLAHNVPPFILFGWLLRGYFGAWAFPWICVVAGVLSNYVTIFMYSLDESGPRLLLGASGMVYAMVGMWLVLFMFFDKRRSVGQRALRAVGFGLALFFPKTFEPRVSYLAHFSGFLIGGALGIAAIPFFRHFSPLAIREREVQFRDSRSSDEISPG